jgi:hypothetical protein
MVTVVYLEKGIDAMKEFLHKHQFFQETDKPGSSNSGR